MRTYVNGQAEVIVSGANVAEAIENLLVLFPAMRQHLTNEHGDLRPFVNLFLEGRNIRDLQGMDTPLDSRGDPPACPIRGRGLKQP